MQLVFWTKTPSPGSKITRETFGTTTHLEVGTTAILNVVPTTYFYKVVPTSTHVSGTTMQSQQIGTTLSSHPFGPDIFGREQMLGLKLVDMLGRQPGSCYLPNFSSKCLAGQRLELDDGTPYITRHWDVSQHHPLGRQIQLSIGMLAVSNRRDASYRQSSGRKISSVVGTRAIQPLKTLYQGKNHAKKVSVWEALVHSKVISCKSLQVLFLKELPGINNL